VKADELVDFWDGVVDQFLDGGSAVPERLQRWYEAYKGAGRGEVMLDALPELWSGRLGGPNTRAVFLQLNPGLAVDYQLRDGMFADEIRRCGRYSAWTATWPYSQPRKGVRDPVLVGSNESIPAARFWKGAARFGNVRLRFARTWFEDPMLTLDGVVMFELYPWHSRGLTKAIRPDVDVVREYVWEPIANTGAPIIFAFGAPWFDLLRRLDVEVLAELDANNGLGSAVASRCVMFGRARGTGTVILAEKHAGSAGPPRASEVEVIRQAYARVV
jgi:hypothetical protein